MRNKIILIITILLLLSLSGYFFYKMMARTQAIPLSSPPSTIQVSDQLKNFSEKTRTIFVGETSATTVLNYAVHWNATSQTEGIYDQNGKLITKGLKQYLEEYTILHPEIAFNIRIILEDDPAERLTLWYENNYPIDIFQTEANSIADFVKAGIVDIPPDEIITDIKKNYATYQNAFYKDQIWGYPTEINTYQLVYNKKILKEAGINTPPKTWSELVDVATKTTKKDENGRIIQYGFAFGKSLNWQVVEPFLAMLFTNNGKFIENNISFLSQKEAIDTLAAQVELFQNNSTNASISIYNFQNSTVAMILCPPWLKTTFQNSFGDNFKDTVGVAPVPYLSVPATFQYGWYLGVESNSPNKNEAWKFLKWFNSEIQTASNTTRNGDFLVKNIGAIPSRKIDIENHKDYLNDFFTAPFIKSLDIAKAQQYFIHDTEIKNILRENIVFAWNQYKTPKQALNDASAQINSFLQIESP